MECALAFGAMAVPMLPRFGHYTRLPMTAALPATIYVPTDEEVHSGVLGRHLREFNYRFVGEYAQTHYLRLNAKDAEGRLLGGLRSLVALSWLRVEPNIPTTR